MPIKKEKIFKKIDSRFTRVKSLIYTQFDILDELIMLGYDNLPKQMVKDFNNNEEEIDLLEIKVSENIVQYIVLHQPVASDLRQIIAYFRMISNIERIGDQLNNIFGSIQSINPSNISIQNSADIINMISISRKMLARSLDSFTESNLDYAHWTIKNDKQIDDLQDQLSAKNINEYSNDIHEQIKIKNIIKMSSILSNIERIADNATNIAEASIYFHSGLDIRHSKVSSKVDTFPYSENK